MLKECENREDQEICSPEPNCVRTMVQNAQMRAQPCHFNCATLQLSHAILVI